jgi:hypothetical protein
MRNIIDQNTRPRPTVKTAQQLLALRDAEEKLYRELRRFFDSPDPGFTGGTAVGQLSVHQTRLFDNITTILRTAVTDVAHPPR